MKSDPPPIPNRQQSRSTFKSPPSPTKPSRSVTNTQSRSLTRKPKQKKKATRPIPSKPDNYDKPLPSKPPPLPKKPASKHHQKAHSVNLSPQLPIRPLAAHPTIGEFYSSRARKNKLLKRQLPSKPKDVHIYFVLMGKIYQYIINICLEHKLSLLLPKLSQMLTTNEEILEIIMREVGRTDRSLSSISKKIHNKSTEDSTYDTIIKNPIFIYKNETYQGSQTLIQIGYKRDLDKLEYQQIMNTNEDEKNDESITPFIVILSCTKQEEDPFDMKTSVEFISDQRC